MNRSEPLVTSRDLAHTKRRPTDDGRDAAMCIATRQKVMSNDREEATTYDTQAFILVILDVP